MMRAPVSAGGVAIVGGGISGLAAAFELARVGREFTLFEASERLGGTIETVRTQGFVVECGPDSWITEKPWARDFALELGLGDQILFSNDSDGHPRTTYLLHQGRLVPMPDGMRMMVPGRLEALEGSPLFSRQAIEAYLREPGRAADLKASAPASDESVASFVRRHFGEEVTRTVAAPLLSGVFGGDIELLSVRAVMPAFVTMEAEHGSLIAALEKRLRPAQVSEPIFSSFIGGMATLTEAIVAELPPGALHLAAPVKSLRQDGSAWQIATARGELRAESLMLATPAAITRGLLQSMGQREAKRMSELLPRRSSSSIVVALGFDGAEAAGMEIPRGFGFLVPPPPPEASDPRLLACTFVDQKFFRRAPAGGVLLRAFFGGAAATALQPEPDDLLAGIVRKQLAEILGPLPPHLFAVVRRLPDSLPQYEVGHLERIEELESLARAYRGLHLIGNAYHGVGVSDLIRAGRAAACAILS
jgi:oxygen-dependent protoporphyrinogen oxidase